MGGNAREEGRSTTSRVLALLGAFTPMRVTLSLTDLATAAGLPVATAHRLAAELVAWGALERLPGGAYQIGVRLWRIGVLSPGARDLVPVAQRFMGDLHEATRETVQLAVPDGRRVRIVETVTGRGSARPPVGAGGHVSLHGTAAGRVIMAFGPPVPAPVGSDPVDLTDVRRQHVAAVAGDPAGTSSVASPVFGRDGTMVAAITVVVRAGTDVRVLTPAVRTAALGVTRILTAGA